MYHRITLAAALLALPAMAAPAGYFQVPGTDTTLKLYGNVQLRQAYGLNGDGLNTNLTARSGGNQDTQQKGQWSGSWRYYMGVTTTTPSEFGDVVTKIEGRFKHNSSTASGQEVNFNLEHGYVKIGGLLAGTTTSLFGYGAWEPNTLFGCFTDENGDWIRVRQITYMTSLQKGFDLGLSLEAQNTDSVGTSNGAVPNVSAVAAYSQPWGGVTLALNYQQKKDWTLAGNDASGSGMSWFLSGGWNLTPTDLVTAMVIKAGGSYGTWSNKTSSGPEFFGVDKTDATSYYLYKSLACNVSYTHRWDDQLSSSLTLGQVKWAQDAQAGVADDFKLTEIILSTTWQMTKTVSLGVEYQHAQMKASGTQPFKDDNGVASDTNKLDQFRFKLKANLF